MKDLISRQAVLNLLHALPPEEVTTKAMLIQSVKQMDAPDNLVKDSQGLAKDLVNDCISRKAAIDALGERPMVWAGSDYELGARNQYDADVLAIETVPSAQPKKRTEERTEMHACDCVSRQAAIDAARDWYEGLICGSFKGLEKRLRSLPSAQPERKRGKWLADNRSGGGFWVCSCCKFPSEAFAADVLYKYCPNCGADMRGRQNG